MAAGRKPDPPVSSRHGSLLVDRRHRGAVAAALWIVSGPIFPLWLELAVPSSGVTLDTYVRFSISDALSGLIAATQCFYAMTFLVLRFCYPRLLQAGTVEVGLVEGDQLRQLESLAWRSRIYFGLAVAVPFIAVVAAVFMGPNDRMPVVVLAGIGLAGFALAYFFDLSLRGDLAALAGVLSPSGDTLGSRDTLDSFLTSSRRRAAAGDRRGAIWPAPFSAVTTRQPFCALRAGGRPSSIIARRNPVVAR